MERLNDNMAVDFDEESGHCQLIVLADNLTVRIDLDTSDVLNVTKFLNKTAFIPDGRKFKLE